MKTKLLTLLVLTLGILAGPAWTHETDGVPNLYEIRPCLEDGTTHDYGYAAGSPMGAGETVFFKLRLASTDAMMNDMSAGQSDKWTYRYKGTGSEMVDDLMTPLKIGIYVSGKLRYAEYVNYADPNAFVRDFIFKYTTQPGDFALPIRLALTTGPAGYTETNPNYVFLNGDKWAIVDRSGQAASFTMIPSVGHSAYNYGQLAQIEPSGRETDYSLISANFHVKTVDFGAAWEEENAYWRKVHSGSTVTESLAPCLEASSAPSEAVTLYVWSRDDSIVSVKSDETVDLILDPVSGTTRTVKVGTIRFEAGQMVRNFQIEGGANQLQGTELVLSAFKQYTYNAAGKRLEDYVTVPVFCLEPRPPTLVVESDANQATVYANGDRPYKSVATLSVYLTQAFTNEIVVTVTPTFQNADVTADVRDYIFFSTSMQETSTRPTGEWAWPTVTIPAGSTTRQKIFLYALRADDNTRGEGNQIVFTPTFDRSLDPAGDIEEEPAKAGVWIHADPPVITTPAAGVTFGAVAGDEKEVTVVVKDTVADEQDRTKGYEIWFKPDDMSDFQQIPGAFFSVNGKLLAADADGNLRVSPKLSWNNSGESQKSVLRVVSPVSGMSSEVEFFANVRDARTVKIEATDGKNGMYNEGESVKFKITLSEKNTTGKTIYAFLLPSSNAQAGMFSQNGGNSFIIDPNSAEENKGATQGIPIDNGTGDENTPADDNGFMLLDGGNVATGGLGLRFSVVLCTTPAYDDDTRVTGYNSNYLKISSYNVEPVVADVTMNNLSMNRFLNAERMYPYALPKNKVQTFRPAITDVAYDKVNNIAPAPDYNMQYQWMITHASSAPQMGVTNYVTTTAPEFKFNFPRAGVWTIEVQARDKDMDEGTWSQSLYSFTVNVLDQPKIGVEVADLYLETETERTATVRVGSEWLDIDPNDYIAVLVTVTNPDGSAANPGAFRLNATKTGRDSYADLPADTKEGPNQYYVFLETPGYTELGVTLMDGTSYSEARGFKIDARVLGNKEGADGRYAETGAYWRDYFLPSDPTMAYVQNVAPFCSGVTTENTNAWVVAGGAATSYPIRFTVKSDVAGDWEGIPSHPGVKVTIDAPGGKTTSDGAEIATPLSFYATESGTYVFTPNFGSLQGDQVVTLTVEDKDGGIQTWRYMYTVTPSKFLHTVASGPSAGISTSALSRRYAEAKGRGHGHVYVPNAILSKGENFTFSWNCSKNTAMNVLAWGYKVGQSADGSINAYDYAITGDGALATAAPYYAYADEERDSYLYTWLQHTVAEQGGMASALLGSVSPEQAEIKAPATGIVQLPNEQTEDGNYLDTYAEAVFAKEWRALDNAGDINQDGIPDRAVLKYGLGVINTGDGTMAGDDLADVSAYNEDQDFLPAGATGGNSLVPNVSGNWATQGRAFNAYLEIRGFGEGLNAGYPNPDGTVTPDYSPNEQRAYLLWKGLTNAEGEPLTREGLANMTDADLATLFEANIAAAAEDLRIANSGIAGANNGDPDKGWSPERPTNPMEPDTDKDGVDDGYEYWFWYAAKVGFTKDGKWQASLSGRRMNLGDLAVFDAIAPQDICFAFDPLVNAAGEGNAATQGSLETRDFDNDGLLDKEEYLIGTNPVDCDTDNGGVPDGFEVMWGLNPLNAEDDAGNASNPDGDHMAWADLGETTFLQFVEANVNEDATVHTRRCYLVVEPVDAEGAFVGVHVASRPEADVANPTPFTLEEVTMSFAGATIPNTRLGGRVRVSLPADPDLAGTIDETLTAPALTLVHDQVFAFFGFDPRTAWSSGCQHGYLTARWCPTCGENAIGTEGAVVNTRPFSVWQEYLYGSYRRTILGLWDQKADDTVLAVLKKNCTNPNAIFEDKAYGDSPTTYASERHGADTNGDGVADGWTIYCGGDPLSSSPPWGTQGVDPLGEDELPNVDEFTATDTIAVYKDCPTIGGAHTNGWRWLNKFFPTNPDSGDTDGDGVKDEYERDGYRGAFYAGNQTWTADFTFIYGNATDDGLSTCFRGGGMNPCSVDTDMDAIPDGWEYDFAGIVVDAAGNAPNVLVSSQAERPSNPYTDAMQIADGVGLPKFAPKGEYVTGGMDATDPFDAQTGLDLSADEPDEITGTFRDRDFDGDGLENFQEYLVQSVRAWRYDDAETPLMGRGIVWQADGDAKLSEFVPSFPQMSLVSGAEYFAAVQGATDLWNAWATPENAYAATLTTFDYETLGYMAPCRNEWDPFWQREQALRTLAFDFDLQYCFMRRPQTMLLFMGGSPDRASALSYVSTDPRRWDSDADGMDDYWEIFHGMNPLLGENDVISEAYLGVVSDEINVWNGLGGLYPSIEDPGKDPTRAPWRTGLPGADPDGDGLVNRDEMIAGNMTSPSPSHTDPTPLWMTDKTSPTSYVSQFYPLWTDDDLSPDIPYYPWLWFFDEEIGTIEGASEGYRFSFEETEGYDTDGDWKGDGHEVVKNGQPMSDPLDATDPARRAALYLPGEDACAYSRMEGNLPVVDAFDVFRQFTVECWVKPESLPHDGEQTILERGFVYDGSNLENAAAKWRANFRLALTAEGRVYGLFDNANPVDTGAVPFSTQRVDGDVLTAGEWAHVALSFDGKELALYVNGKLRAAAKTALVPANGVTVVLQEPGVTNLYPMATYLTAPGANTIGARRRDVAFDWEASAGFEQFTDFFQGWISEVRFWDGARTQTEIVDGFGTAMSAEDAAANREAVYAAWRDGATRNDADGGKTLPAQLMSLYNFQQLPAAVDPDWVAKIPSGFEAVQKNSGLDDPADLVVGWWAATPLASTVYTDARVVPWVQNTVSHLPFLDESFADSMYWSQHYAGYTPAQMHGVSTYEIPNGGNPYGGRSYMAESDLHHWRLTRLAEYQPSAEESAERYAFEMRSRFVGLDDLVALGGAHAKPDADYWDGLGASTAWSDTGADADGDGLPDWWETLYGGTVDPADPVDRDGETMSAWEAYLRDLAAGMQPGPDGKVDENYAAKEDADGDGLVDWWQAIYAVEGGANGDADGDGLANYVEYLLSEVFGLRGPNGAKFSPTNPFSVNSNVSDYFFKIGEAYVGEIFTDHDRTDDTWEDRYPNEAASRYAYDATFDDYDKDGWSNYAEFQAGTDPTKLGSLGVDEVQMSEYPVPVIEAKVTYEGTQVTTGKPIVVKAWRDATLQTKPDAVWTIGGEAETGANGATGSTGSNSANGATEQARSLKYVGMNPNRQVRLSLSPGSVVAGKVEIEFKDTNWILLNMTTGQSYVSAADTAVWQGFIKDEQIGSSDKGRLVYSPEELVVGEIDYTTGAVLIDFTLLPEYAAVDGDISAVGGTGDVGATAWISLYRLAASYIRLSWRSKTLVGGSTATYYLADAEKPTEANNSLGHVKEGRNTFVAFCDLDGDGKYTAGEPYGVAPDVNVGWNAAKVAIELTDTSPVTARFSVGSDSSSGGSSSGGTDTGSGGASSEATNDRNVLYGIDSGNLSLEQIIDGKPSGGVFQRVRVVRTLINGQPTYGYDGTDPWAVSRVVLDKLVNVNNDPYLTEADFLRDGNLDIDWATLADDLDRGDSAKKLITNVTYRIVLGDGDVSNLTTNNLLSLAFNRWFDAPEVYSKDAKPVARDLPVVRTPSPIFKWEIPYGFNSYTAFQIEITDENGTSVWKSGFRPMPPRYRDGDPDNNTPWLYEWKAPLFAGALTADGKEFANNRNYKWRVSVSNARFKNMPVWSETKTFRMEVQTNVTDLAVMDVAVGYFGPSAVANAGKIRVQAFTTPDFSGSPVGEGFVADAKTLTNGATEANARIVGLEAGTYYVRAFIDTQLDGACADWESWGFACDRDVRGCAIYTPKAIKVGPGVGLRNVIPVFIDDCDTDGDRLPDAWEWQQKKSLDAMNVTHLDKTLSDSFAVRAELTQRLNDAVGGTLTDGLSVMFAALDNPYVVAMVTGTDVSQADGADDVAAALSAKAEEAVEPKSVDVTDVAFDAATGKVTIKVSAATDDAAAGSASAIYQFEARTTVTIKVWHKASLADSWSEEPVSEKTVVIDASGANETELAAQVDYAGSTQGFFKVTLEKAAP